MTFICICRRDDLQKTHLSNDELEQTSISLRTAASNCNRLARETVELCTETVIKGSELVSLGNDIHGSLVGIANNMNAEALVAIRDLIDGDEAKAALALAWDMDDLVILCVTKSVQMIDELQQGVDALPTIIENFVEHKARKLEASQEQEEMINVEDDIVELETCIDAIENLSLMTAMETGNNTFQGISSKADIFMSIFESIRKFAQALVGITNDFANFCVGAVITKSKDILHCIGLSSLMKKFAEESQKLIRVIIELFHKSSGELSSFWSALAYTKDCLSDCVPHVTQARVLCRTANNDGGTLIQKTNIVKKQLTNMDSIDSKTILSLGSLVTRKDINECIWLASNMENSVSECTQKVGIMIYRVTQGFDNLPDILTKGILDISESGQSESDPDPVNVEDDIADLERSKEAIENGDAISSVTFSLLGFSVVTEKLSTCKDLLKASEGFVENCNGAIQSFMGVWNFEDAIDKIQEMCRLVKLGDLIKQRAEQVQKLLRAIITVMRAVIDKLEKVPQSICSFTNSLGETDEAVSDLVRSVKKAFNF